MTSAVHAESRANLSGQGGLMGRANYFGRTATIWVHAGVALVPAAVILVGPAWARPDRCPSPADDHALVYRVVTWPTIAAVQRLRGGEVSLP